MPVVIARNSCTLSRDGRIAGFKLEILSDTDGTIFQFDDEAQAKQWLRDIGYEEKEIDRLRFIPAGEH